MSTVLVIAGVQDSVSGDQVSPKAMRRVDRRQAWSATLDAAITHGLAFCIEPQASVSLAVAAYIEAAREMYREDPRVALFALSAWRFRPDGRTPFVPIEDGYDTVFGCMPPPVNFAVTAVQASRLRAEGVQTNADVEQHLTATKSHALYPRASLVLSPDKRASRQLDPDVREWRLGPLDVALAIYDSDFEIAASVLKRLNPALANYAFDVELSGRQGVGTAPYLLSARPCSTPIMSFALEMTPWEANIALDVVGDMFSLAPRDAFEPMTRARRARLLGHLTRHTYIGGYLKQFIGQG